MRILSTAPAVPVAAILVALFSFAAPTDAVAAESLEEKVRKIKAGRRVEVKLKSGDKVVGKMGAVQQMEFTLEPDKAGLAPRTFTFAETQSIKSKLTRGEKGAIWVAVAVAWMAFAVSFGG